MQTASMGIAAPQKRQQMSRQLDEIFHVVDLIKSDLTQCGKGMNGKDRVPFSAGHNFFNIRSREQAIRIVNYRYHPKCQMLTRRQGQAKAEVVITNVSDFFISYFPESQSVLYRIEINNREQVRGYVFMPHLQKN